jgi:predicted phosphatase
MFTKEILSKRKLVLLDILQKKALNRVLYEKAYTRTRSSNSDLVQVIDNNSFFFYQKKIRIKTKNDTLDSIDIENDSALRIIEDFNSKGYSIYSTIFLYKNRKNNLLRFELSLNRFSNIMEIANNYLNGLRKLVTKTDAMIQQESTLILLSAKNGGFTCYSSGFQGFLCSSQFFLMLVQFIDKLKVKSKYNVIPSLQLILQSQRIYFLTISSPRFVFDIKAISPYCTLARRNYKTSRRFSTDIITIITPQILFCICDRNKKVERIKQQLVRAGILFKKKKKNHKKKCQVDN